MRDGPRVRFMVSAAWAAGGVGADENRDGGRDMLLDDSAGVVDLAIGRQIDAATFTAERFERGGDVGGQALDAGEIVGVGIDARPGSD